MSQPSRYEEDHLLQLSGLQHFAFCPRQWALIHLEQQWQENQLTIEGSILHERADDPGYVEKRDKLLIVRALPLVSYRLGISGKADVVEFLQTNAEEAYSVKLEGRRGQWRPSPVEYKRGKPKTTDIDRVQLCAQAICLEEMLNTVIDAGSIFYWEVRSREAVQFDEQIRREVETLALEMHRSFENGQTPAPKQQAGCKRCSLKDVCLPELNRAPEVKAYLQKVFRELKFEESEEGCTSHA